jgi:uncharacterized protein YciI
VLFIILATDKPGSAHIRADNRPAHMEYDMADRAAVEAFAGNDPFAKAGLFQSTEIRRWRKVIFNPAAA